MKRASNFTSYCIALRAVGARVLFSWLDGDVCAECWDAVRVLAGALLVFCFRVLTLVTFPVSVPLIALYLVRSKSKQVDRWAEEARHAQEAGSMWDTSADLDD